MAYVYNLQYNIVKISKNKLMLIEKESSNFMGKRSLTGCPREVMNELRNCTSEIPTFSWPAVRNPFS